MELEHPSFVISEDQTVDVKSTLGKTDSVLKYLQIPMEESEAPLYQDHTNAATPVFRENNVYPFSNIHDLLMDENEVESTLYQQRNPGNQEELYSVKPLVNVNGTVYETAPATAFFYGALNDELTWKECSELPFESEENLENEYSSWVDLNLDNIDADVEEALEISSENEFQELGYQNTKNKTIATIEYDDIQLPMMGGGQRLKKYVKRALKEAHKDGELQPNIPPSQLLNTELNNDKADYIKITSDLIPENYDIAVDAMPEEGNEVRFLLHDSDEDIMSLITPSTAYTHLIETEKPLQTTVNYEESKNNIMGVKGKKEEEEHQRYIN